MTYPEIDIEEFLRVTAIIESAVADPEYLDPALCPYDEQIIAKIKDLVSSLFSPVKTSPDVEKNPVGRPRKGPVIPIDEVEKEVDEIRREISQLKLDAENLETNDRIQIIKTRAALVEKIIGMKERINDVKKQRQFVVEVIAIMEDIMEQKQREEMIKRLEPYINE